MKAAVPPALDDGEAAAHVPEAFVVGHEHDPLAPVEIDAIAATLGEGAPALDRHARLISEARSRRPVTSTPSQCATASAFSLAPVGEVAVATDGAAALAPKMGRQKAALMTLNSMFVPLVRSETARASA